MSIEAIEHGAPTTLQATDSVVSVRAGARVPTTHGEFQILVFGPNPFHALHAPGEHVALVRGNVRDRKDVLVRVHSECMTSEVFGSLKCDCREQLERAQATIGQLDCGVILYLRQEGRGIGLANKIRAYDLQSKGVDTVDANRALGLPDDARSYGVAASMLEELGICSVQLMTNNPAKVEALRSAGIIVSGVVPLVVAPNQHSAAYLECKRVRMRHAIPTQDAY